MAKKTARKPIYPVASLTVSRERFCSLLSEQINRGNGLLKKKVSVVNTVVGYDYFSGRNTSERVVYNEQEEEGFVNDYRRWNDRNKSIYRSSFSNPESIYYHEYESLDGHIWGSDSVTEYKEKIRRFINHMQSDIERCDLMSCSVEESPDGIVEEKQWKQSGDVFIVHGHNNEIKQAVARVVEKLGLTPVILHEQPNGGKTIIDKFETNAGRIGFAIIILSADDLGASVRDLVGLSNEEARSIMEKRARQNVVFEMGFFAGRIGRSHLLFLLQDGVTKPGDLDGIVYTKYDDGGAWKFELVKELRNSGYPVSADSLL